MVKFSHQSFRYFHGFPKKIADLQIWFIFPLLLLAIRHPFRPPVFHPQIQGAFPYQSAVESSNRFPSPRRGRCSNHSLLSLGTIATHSASKRSPSHFCFQRDIHFFSYPGGVVEHPYWYLLGGKSIHKRNIHSLKLTWQFAPENRQNPKKKWIFPKPSILRSYLSLREGTTEWYEPGDF